MSDEAVAVTSPATEAPAIETVSIPRSGTPEYKEWRETGKVAEPKPKAESAPASSESVDAGEATPPQKKQEKRKPDAEARIKILTDESNRLRAELEEARRPKSEPEAKPQPKEAQYTRPKPKADDKSEDGKPKYDSYEDFVEELADWKAEQRLAQQSREQQMRQFNDDVKAKVVEAEKRYTNFQDIAQPTIKALTSKDVPLVIQQMINDSDIWPDLLYALGEKTEELDSFVEMAKTKPRNAVKYLVNLENFIGEELEKGSSTAATSEVPRGTDGKFTAPPAKRGPESAPEPPLEIGNRGSGPIDESQRALSDMQAGKPNAFREWMRAENAKELRLRRGA